jgi:ribonuclease HI
MYVARLSRHYTCRLFFPSGWIEKYQFKSSRGYSTQHWEVTGAGKCLAGAGVTCEMLNMALPAGKLGCNYDGEVAAIQAARQRLALQNPPSQKYLVVLTDSIAAIQAISSPESQNSTIAEIRTLVHDMQRNCEVMFQWIPSHCDLPGNDKTDDLAKAGASMKQPVTKIPLHRVRTHLAASVKEKMRKEWTTAGRGKKWPKAQAKEEKRS